MKRVYIVTSAARIVVPVAKRVKWTAERRLHVALSNNNQGTWWACMSRYTVADLERRFTEGSVASLLYNVTGGLLGDPKLLRAEHGFYIYGQWTRMDGDVLVSLRDIDVEPRGPVAWSQAIKHP